MDYFVLKLNQSLIFCCSPNTWCELGILFLCMTGSSNLHDIKPEILIYLHYNLNRIWTAILPHILFFCGNLLQIFIFVMFEFANVV